MEEKNRQIAGLQAFKDNWEPVILWLPNVVEKWHRYENRLSYAEAELLRLYKHSLKGEKEIEDKPNDSNAGAESRAKI